MQQKKQQKQQPNQQVESTPSAAPRTAHKGQKSCAYRLSPLDAQKLEGTPIWLAENLPSFDIPDYVLEEQHATPLGFCVILLNIPHASSAVFDAERWDDVRQLSADIRHLTDWHTDLLFSPDKCLTDYVQPYVFPFSRFFVDVERLEDDPMEKIGQGIVYTRYGDNERHIAREDKSQLLEFRKNFLAGLAQQLARKCRILIDCHSFASSTPNPEDVDICLGYNDDDSYDVEVVREAARIFTDAGYRVGFNTPFANSLTPSKPITYKSMMIEVNKRCYMNEATLELTDGFDRVRRAINRLYARLLAGN